MNIESPIFLTGAARSGTSMCAGVINMCGAFGGQMRGATRNNQKGMFENAEVCNTIAKPYLRSINCDAMGQYPLPDINKLTYPNDLRKRVEDIMIRQGYRGGAWMYKGAKLCLVWPIWQAAFPNAKWIIVRRRTADIVNSCCKTGFMRAFRQRHSQRAVGVNSEAEGWLWWVHQHEKRFAEMIQAGMNVKVVWPERMVHNDYTQMRETVDWLGLKWTDDVMSFISPKLWKSKVKLWK